MTTTGWETGGHTQTVEVGPDGKATDAMRVEYHNTDKTIHGHVTVPMTDGWETAAVQALQARYAQHQAVMSA